MAERMRIRVQRRLLIVGEVNDPEFNKSIANKSIANSQEIYKQRKPIFSSYI